MAVVWNYTSGFNFGPNVVIGMWFGIGLWILSELDDRWCSCDFQDGGHSVANLLLVTALVTYRISIMNAKICMHT